MSSTRKQGTGKHSRMNTFSRALFGFHPIPGGVLFTPLLYTTGGRGSSGNPLFTGLFGLFRHEIDMLIWGATFAFLHLEEGENRPQKIYNGLGFFLLLIADFDFYSHQPTPGAASGHSPAFSSSSMGFSFSCLAFFAWCIFCFNSSTWASYSFLALSFSW